ncbi:MAG: amino acid--tRNA ligase-related protein [Nanoarchaeota archaeon]
MIGPYKAGKEGRITYKGNKIFSPLNDIRVMRINPHTIGDRVNSIHDDDMYSHISKINDTINSSTVNYFSELGALFIPLPLTTRMISPPGAVYGRGKINCTTDTCPITLDWFDLSKKAFLSESSQIYLELALLQTNINHVFANYNSFRKEKADATHLSEFHHIEYEGKVNQNRNLEIAGGLLKRIVKDLTSRNVSDLMYFVNEKSVAELNSMLGKTIPIVTLKDALDLLYKSTHDEKYKEFTLKNFNAWEEIKLTELVGGIVGVSEMPLLEVPFYHAKKDGSEVLAADNCDIILPGYRETIGSGHRVRSTSELEEKAVLFNLPREDYEPYLQSRRFADYEETSGFGLGWERFLQGLLEMPFVYSASLFPRIDSILKP